MKCRMGIGLLAVALIISCARAPSLIEGKASPEKKYEELEFKSKPVKMPPTNARLGKICGLGIDELFPLQQSDNVLIYDVRVPYFYNIDHIPGAVNWPYSHYDEEVQERDLEIQKALKGGKKVVAYCFNLGCPEARNVAKKLARRDYEIHVFGSGIDSWRDAGLPLE